MHPISAKKLYLSICLPRTLNGCELWYQISKTGEIMLEKTHRFCSRCLQGFKRRTRTDVSTAAIGIASITSYIHQSLQPVGLLSRNPLLPFKLWSASRIYPCLKYFFDELVCISVCVPLSGDRSYFSPVEN